MTRLVLCVIALVAALVGQQKTQIPPPPSGFTVDQSEVTPVPQSAQEKTARKPRAKASAAPDMRPAAVCAREMNDALDNLDKDNSYLAEMEKSQREDLHQRALDCLSLQQSAKALRVTALVLNETALSLAFDNGLDFGTQQAAEAQAASKTAVCEREILGEFQNILKANGKTSMGPKDFAQMEKSQLEDLEKQAYDCLQGSDAHLAAWILDQTTWDLAYDAATERGWVTYKALVSDYNSLVRQYNTLLGVANNLASRLTVITVPSFMPPPPQRDLHLNCTAIALPGNMATVNCW
jgi:hypothetical protein